MERKSTLLRTRKSHNEDGTDGAAGQSVAEGNSRIGAPDGGGMRQLRRSGQVLAFADLLWIGQAALIAWAFAQLVKAFETAGAAEQPSADLASDDLFGVGWQAMDWPSVDLMGAGAHLVPVIAGIVVLAGVRAALHYAGMNQARIAARTIQSAARADLLQSVVLARPSDPLPSSGAFAAHLTEQVDLLGPYYRNYVPQMMRLKIVPVVIVLATLPFSWLAAVILMISGPVIPVFMALIGMRAKKASEAQQDELTRMSGMLLDRIRGLETLTLFGALDRTLADVAGAGERFRKGTMKVLSVAFLSSTVLELFSALGIAFVAVYVGFSLLGDISFGTWSAPLTYGSGLFILLMAPEFFAPLRGFAAAYHDRAAGIAALEKLNTIAADVRPASVLAEDGAAAPLPVPSAPAIRLDGVTIVHGNRTVFEDLRLEIAAGETILLHGASGSGKTTLIDAVLGFARPSRGTVLVDDNALNAPLAKVLRQQTMWLGQAPRLFHGSVKANLLMGHPGRDRVCEAELWDSLELAGVQDLVRGMPRGLATPIGEDGFGLSVGEIRRLCLARAALRREAVLLLADEPTAGLDDETAQDVIAGLARLAKGRTSVIATHSPAVLEMPGRRIDVAGLSGAAMQGAAR